MARLLLFDDLVRPGHVSSGLGDLGHVSSGLGDLENPGANPVTFEEELTPP